MLALLAALSLPEGAGWFSKSFLLTTPVTLGSSGSSGSLNHSPAVESLLARKPSLVIVGTSPGPPMVDALETEVATDAEEVPRFIFLDEDEWRGAEMKPRMS